jgi:hypothetical protein
MGDFRSEDPYLIKRYGTDEKRFPSWLPLAIALIISGLLWTFWSGAKHSIPEIRYDLVSFKPISEKSIEIRFTVNFKSKEKAHYCRLVARDIAANIAGEKIYEFPAKSPNQDITTQIPTRVAAVNAGILGCQVR